MRTHLFLLNNYPCVDHLAPLIWACLERGERTLVVFDQPFPNRDDYRIRFLARYPEFRILDLTGVASQMQVVRGASRLLWTSRRIEALLRAHHVDACFVDWGPGLGHGKAPALWWGSRVLEELRALREGTPRQGVARTLVPHFRTACLAAACRAGIPRFCLPHGAWTILNRDYTRTLQGRLRESSGKSPGVQGFTVFVVSAVFHQEMLLQYEGTLPELIPVWGSLRYSREWMAVVRQICPQPSWPSGWEPQKTRLLFVMPKGDVRVDYSRVWGLLEGLAARPDVALVCKGHPRTGLVATAGMSAVLNRPNVWTAPDAHSPALVAGTAATIALNSSVGIDALLQGRPLIYPRFLHENRLVYDDLGGCLAADTDTDVHRIVDAIVAGAPPIVPEADVQRVVSATVYGGREPYDVPAYYYNRITEQLASSTPPT